MSAAFESDERVELVELLYGDRPATGAARELLTFVSTDAADRVPERGPPFTADAPVVPDDPAAFGSQSAEWFLWSVAGVTVLAGCWTARRFRRKNQPVVRLPVPKELSHSCARSPLGSPHRHTRSR